MPDRLTNEPNATQRNETNGSLLGRSFAQVVNQVDSCLPGSKKQPTRRIQTGAVCAVAEKKSSRAGETRPLRRARVTQRGIAWLSLL